LELGWQRTHWAIDPLQCVTMRYNALHHRNKTFP
jgi:hypothetical protein